MNSTSYLADDDTTFVQRHSRAILAILGTALLGAILSQAQAAATGLAAALVASLPH